MSATTERAALLAVAEAGDVVALAERCLDVYGDPSVLIAPETGLVVMQVREPVCAERFHLGEVVVTRAEVEIHGHRGWSMRLGHDRVATLGAAVCDAVAAGSGPLAADVEALCQLTRERRAQQLADEWSEIAPTLVEFEELT